MRFVVYLSKVVIHPESPNAEVSLAVETPSGIRTQTSTDSLFFLIEGEREDEVFFHVAAEIEAPEDEMLPSVVTGMSGFKLVDLRGEVNGQVISVDLEEGYEAKFVLVPIQFGPIKLAPPLDRGTSDLSSTHVAIDAPPGNVSTGGRNTLNARDLFICQPGNYSGDCWHIGAALVLDPTVTVVVPRTPVLPMTLSIQSYAFQVELLYFEIQLRSSLGIIDTFTPDHGLPFEFHQSGNVELWIRAWVRSPDGQHVLHYSATRGVGPVVEDRNLSFTLKATHGLTFESYCDYVDEYIELDEDLPSIEAQISCTATPLTTQRGIVQPDEYPEDFASQNLRLKLVPIATPIFEELVKALTGYRLTGLDWESASPLLQQAFLDALCGAPRRLFVKSEQVTTDTKVYGRCKSCLHKFLLPFKEVETTAIGAFMTDQHVKALLRDAAILLAKKFEQFFDENKRKQTEAKYVLVSNQFLDFYADCKVPYSRVITKLIEQTPRQGPQAFAAGRRIVREISGEEDPPCGMTFAATSILMNAVEQLGIEEVRARLVKAFIGSVDSRLAEEIDRKINVVKGSPCVILNMRLGGYHPEHDVTEGIFRQITEFARSHGLRLICAGQMPPKDWKSAPGVEIEVLDVYKYADLTDNIAKQVDLRHTAYLWQCVAAQKNCIGIIGGMSGSLDIAAYMGVRTLCWDVALEDEATMQKLKNSAEKQDRIRLLLSYPFMSIIRRRIEGLVTDKGNLKPDAKEKDLLDGVALELWWSGHEIVPLVGKEFAPERILNVKNKDTQSKAFKAVLCYDLPQICDGLRRR
jgi:hypothetical protein